MRDVDLLIRLMVYWF